MEQTFFFYDLETSGINVRSDRIMQFAGRRTSLNLEEIGEPYNILIKCTQDTLPDPQAVLVTGITPQKTIEEGITEAEFCKIFASDIATPGTIFVGFNSIRFDDEFIRFLLWRNFYDPYEWQWKNGRSRWDILDLVRMTRALRPNGITWPYASDGRPANRLELLAAVNKINHTSAHDALSDVAATIALARLIMQKQPKLFSYMLSIHSKQQIQKFISNNPTFIYVSGKYSSEYEKATIVGKIVEHADKSGIYVLDLRIDPEPYLSMTAEQLTLIWHRASKENHDEVVLPVKVLKYNRCPAVAPLGVLDRDTSARLHLDITRCISNHRKITAHHTFTNNLLNAAKLLDQKHEQTTLLPNERNPEEQLYEGFTSNIDKVTSQKITSAQPEKICDFQNKLQDDRLKQILPHYKARNFPKFLTDKERKNWEDFCKQYLTGGKKTSIMARFSIRLDEILARETLTKQDRYVLEELSLYAQSLL